MSSITGISSNLVDFQSPNGQNTGQSKRQQFQRDFQQLGQDLQSGNLTGATADFGAMQMLTPQDGASSASFAASPIGKAIGQLTQDLQAGNLAGVKQDYSSIQKDIQNRVAQRGHHHHHVGNGSATASSLNQAFQELGAALQSGNITSAQQAYGTLQQDLPQLRQTATQPTITSDSSSQTTTTGVSVSA